MQHVDFGRKTCGIWIPGILIGLLRSSVQFCVLWTHQTKIDICSFSFTKLENTLNTKIFPHSKRTQNIYIHAEYFYSYDIYSWNIYCYDMWRSRKGRPSGRTRIIFYQDPDFLFIYLLIIDAGNKLSSLRMRRSPRASMGLHQPKPPPSLAMQQSGLHRPGSLVLCINRPLADKHLL